MELKEYNNLKSYSNEQELYETLELISDKIIFKGYDQDDLVLLVRKILEINILSLSYTTREQLLSTLCDAVSYYAIRNTINWYSILKVKNDVEDDLKEYINEFFV